MTIKIVFVFVQLDKIEPGEYPETIPIFNEQTSSNLNSDILLHFEKGSNVKKERGQKAFNRAMELLLKNLTILSEIGWSMRPL